MTDTRIARALGGLLVALALVGCSTSPSGSAAATTAVPNATAGPSGPPPTDAPGSSQPATSAAPSPSAAGAGRIVFVRFDASSRQDALYTMAPDGSDLRPLLPGYPIGFAVPRWSWSGKLVGAVSGDKLDGIPADESAEHRGIETIIQSDAASHSHIEPASTTVRLVCAAWSPDDLHLACEGWATTATGKDGLYAMSATDGTGLRQLTKAPAGTRDVPGDYSADGRIVFVRTTYAVLHLGEIWIADADGSNAHKVTDTLSTYRVSWSRDGRWIAGTRNGAIEVIDLQHLGADPVLISVPGGTASDPRWSPDATRIVFVYTKAGAKTTGIATVKPDGTGFTQLTTGTVDASPDWASPGF